MPKLNKNQGKTGLVDLAVADIVAIHKQSGVEETILDVTTQEFTKSVSEENVIAGSLGTTCYVLSADAETTFTFETALKHKLLDDVKYSRREVVGGDTTKTVFSATYTVSATGTIVLPEVPIDYANEIVLYVGDTALVETTDYTIDTATKTITMVTNDTEGTKVFCTSYTYSATASDYSVVDGKGLGKEFSLLLKKPLFGKDMSIVAFEYTEIPGAVLSGEISDSFQSEKTATFGSYTFSVTQDSAYDYLMKTYYVDVV